MPTNSIGFILVTWKRPPRWGDFGPDESTRQIQETSDAFQLAHEPGLVTFLWFYSRNPALKADKDYRTAADRTDQASHIRATIEADVLGSFTTH
jgi:class I fructose-bisphosphate aldolase